MNTGLITASTLVNHGLEVRELLNLDADVELADTPPLQAGDVLGSFRQIALDPRVLATAPELAGAIGGFGSTLDLATWFINAKYNELGAAEGTLGRASGAVAPAGSGFMRAFQSGVILWHAAAGAHALWGPIRARWQELGAEGGFLGFPTSDVTTGNDIHAEGAFAHFQGGSIYWAPPSVFSGATGVLTAPSISLAATVEAVGTTGPRPAPSPAVAATDNAARLASAALRNAATAAGVGAATALTGTTAALDGRGLVLPASGNTGVVGPRFDTTLDPGSLLDGVHVLVPSSAGAYEVHGAIREKYLALGAEASILGYPRTDESGTPDGRGRYNHFQGGSIYWTGDTGAHEVHGLIRDRWSALGWERNPQLGYPIADEMIPDRRVGHRRPETLKKPITELPNGVIKLPAAAAAAGFPATVVNTPPATAAAATPTTARSGAPAVARSAIAMATATTAVSRSAGTGALGPLAAGASNTAVTDVADSALRADASPSLQPVEASIAGHAIGTTFDPAVITATLDPAILQALTPASTPAAERSLNRFSDFESGVLFWFRGATTASVLSPLGATQDGTDLSFTGADIAALAVARIGRVNLETANAALVSASCVGTTGYSFDGAQVHNRRHRIQLILQGIENRTTNGPFGIPIPQIVTVNATVELLVEVFFDAPNRRIALVVADWSLQQAGSGAYGTTVQGFLRARLDPLLWSMREVVALPDTDNGAPIAVLAVKTLANGNVGVYVEPHQLRLIDQVGDLATSVNASVITFANPR